MFAHIFGFDITLKISLLRIPVLILYFDRRVLQIFHKENLRNLLSVLRLVLQISDKGGTNRDIRQLHLYH